MQRNHGFYKRTAFWKASRLCPSVLSVSTEHWRNDTNSWKPKNSEKKKIQILLRGEHTPTLNYKKYCHLIFTFTRGGI